MTAELEDLRKTAEKLSVLLRVMRIFSQELDRDYLLPLILKEITLAMDADRSTLFLLDEESGELWSKVAQGTGVTEIRFSKNLGIAGYVATMGETVNIPDAYQDPRFNPDVDRKTGYRTKTLLCTPIRDERGKIIGVVQVINKSGGLFTENDEDLLQALGAQAAIALENARLTAQLTDRIERTESLLDLMHSFTSELERDRLLPVIMEKTTKAMKADRSTLFLIDRKTDELFSRVAQGESTNEIRFPLNRGIAGYVATTGETLNIKDAYSDPRFNPDVDRKSGYHTSTILCMPIKNSEGEILGAVQVLNKKGGFFTTGDEEFLGALASQAAIALDNSNLFEEVVNIKNYNERILRDMATGVLTLDECGRLSMVNPAAERMFSIERKSALGLRYDQALYEAGNRDFINAIAEVQAKGEKYSGYDVKYLLPDDQGSVNFNINIVPLKNRKGQSMGQVLVLEDITQEQRMMSTLSRYVGRGVAEQLVKNKDSLRLGGVRTKVTILFSDIRGFTTLTEGFAAEEIVELLNNYFSRMVRVIFDQGGTLDKFIGDAVMAVFGAPVRHEDGPIRAVKAALDMRKELAVFNASRRAKGLIEIENGIGIGYGDTISGNIGSEQRMDYTVIGDSVNLSSRLESLSKDYPQKIVISESVYEDIKDQVECVPLAVVKVKGKTQETRIYGINDEAVVGSSPDLPPKAG